LPLYLLSLFFKYLKSDKYNAANDANNDDDDDEAFAASQRQRQEEEDAGAEQRRLLADILKRHRAAPKLNKELEVYVRLRVLVLVWCFDVHVVNNQPHL
jgi:hypothetical protein